jgi:hypothetical protein
MTFAGGTDRCPEKSVDVDVDCGRRHKLPPRRT